MSALLYFALWAGFIFLMMRFGCGAHVMGHHHEDHPGKGADPHGDGVRWSPPETDIDPVCRMSVQTAGAKSSVYHGRVYYFCSAEHRDAFEAAPERYVGGTPEEKPLEHHHG
ncbi:MAG TPA: YHS domain-containing protein [Stellaceae bacterium]|nr:YHS domain-containing protein [Stellaceae bacterium]